jgi:hypothetical protein
MDRTTITNLAVADRAGVAVFEVTPRRVMVRPARQGACVCTNHFCSAALEPYLPLNVYKTFDRFAVLRLAARGAGRLGVADLHAALHAARNHRETLQTMVFEPAALRIHLGLGRVPATAGELRTLDLTPLFAR